MSLVASIKDVAQLAGVSLGTVSNFLNRPDKVSEQTAQRVVAAIQELGYVRNDVARQLRVGRSKAIGFVVLDIGNPFFSDVVRAAEDEGASAGMSVLTGSSDESADREGLYLDLFEEQRVHGVLISPAGEVDARAHRLRERGIPTVFVDRVSADTSFSSVAVDDVEGGALAAEHLLSIGRRRIAYIGGPDRIRQVADRRLGAQRAVAGEASARMEWIPTKALTVDEGIRMGTHLSARAVDERPDAIFAANDLLALGLLQALLQHRIRVPGDLALVGYDDIAFAAAAVVPLSSVRQPRAEIGRTAVQILLEEAGNSELPPRRTLYRPELVARQSTLG